MALFGLGKKEKKLEKAVSKTSNKEVVAKTVAPVGGSDITASKVIILRPRITEKASFLSERGVYVFEVSKEANKINIKSEIERMYRVLPLKVRIVKNPTKILSRQGNFGRKQGVKKAYVYLKEGDKIEIV